jgi:hypothetical protein
LPDWRFESKLCRQGKPETAVAASARNCLVLMDISIIAWQRIDEVSAVRKRSERNSNETFSRTADKERRKALRELLVD